MSTVHAYTKDQKLLDLLHRAHIRELRRAGAAAPNIVPSSTGAARAIGEVLAELAGRLDGMAFRVPVACGSVVNLVCTLSRPVTRDEVNGAFVETAADPCLDGTLDVTDTPLVSADIVGRSSSCLFSVCDTMVSGATVKVLGWYDKEWATPTGCWNWRRSSGPRCPYRHDGPRSPSDRWGRGAPRAGHPGGGRERGHDLEALRGVRDRTQRKATMAGGRPGRMKSSGPASPGGGR